MKIYSAWKSFHSSKSGNQIDLSVMLFPNHGMARLLLRTINRLIGGKLAIARQISHFCLLSGLVIFTPSELNLIRRSIVFSDDRNNMELLSYGTFIFCHVIWNFYLLSCYMVLYKFVLVYFFRCLREQFPLIRPKNLAATLRHSRTA